MKKVISIIIGILIVLFITAIVRNKCCNKNVIVDTIDVIDVGPDYVDTFPDPYEGMSEEEILKEQMKGALGNYTLGQIDSMINSCTE